MIIFPEDYRLEFDVNTEEFECKHCKKKYSRLKIFNMPFGAVNNPVKYTFYSDSHSDPAGYYYCGECFDIESDYVREGVSNV